MLTLTIVGVALKEIAKPKQQKKNTLTKLVNSNLLSSEVFPG